MTAACCLVLPRSPISTVNPSCCVVYKYNPIKKDEAETLFPQTNRDLQKELFNLLPCSPDFVCGEENFQLLLIEQRREDPWHSSSSPGLMT